MAKKPTIIGTIGYSSLFWFITVWLSTPLWYELGSPYNPDPPPKNLFYVITIACVLLFPALHFFRYRSWKNKAAEREVRLLAKKACDKLHDLQNEIRLLSEQLGISFPFDDLTVLSKKVQLVIDQYSLSLLRDPTPLDHAVETLSERAKEDKRQLEAATHLYKSALGIYSDTSRLVNRTGSMPLINELEYDYARLTHHELKSLPPQRKWNEFQDAVNAIIADLQRLKDLAAKRKWQEETEHEEFEEEEPAFVETREEKAYRILGVSPSTTYEEIEKMLKRLRMAYHPDNVIEKDSKQVVEDRLKEIEWAANVLKKRQG